MSRSLYWLQWVALSGAFTVIAFISTVAFGEVWGKVWVLWLLIGLTSWLVAGLPVLNQRSAPSGLMLAYGSTFFLLWLSTETVSSARTEPHVAAKMASALLPVVSAFGVLAAIVWLVGSQPKARRACYALLPVLGLGLAVAYFSGDAGSSGRMVATIAKLLHISEHAAATVTFWARKSVHVLFYGTMAFAALRASWQGGLTRSAALVWAVLWCLCHASFDEIRQGAFATRTGSPWDVGLDALGIAAALKLFEGRVTGAKRASASSAP